MSLEGIDAFATVPAMQPKISVIYTVRDSITEYYSSHTKLPKSSHQRRKAWLLLVCLLWFLRLVDMLCLDVIRRDGILSIARRDCHSV